jgi:hypothetical protein
LRRITHFDSDGKATGGTTAWLVAPEEGNQFAPGNASFMVDCDCAFTLAAGVANDPDADAHAARADAAGTGNAPRSAFFANRRVVPRRPHYNGVAKPRFPPMSRAPSRPVAPARPTVSGAAGRARADPWRPTEGGFA